MFSISSDIEISGIDIKLRDSTERSVEKTPYSVACEGKCNVEKLFSVKDIINYNNN
jgi:hypothetical protein